MSGNLRLCTWIALACGPLAASQSFNVLSQAEVDQGFRLLFDGTRESFASNFETYGKSSSGIRLDATWAVNDTFQTVGNRSSGMDIRSVEKYGDFDLRLDFQCDRSSGIYYRFLTTEPLPLYTGVEYLIDNNVSGDGTDLWGRRYLSGAAYDLYAPNSHVYHHFDTGKWNSARIVAIGDSVEHWMNGRKVLGYRYHSNDFWKRHAESKWSRPIGPPLAPKSRPPWPPGPPWGGAGEYPCGGAPSECFSPYRTAGAAGWPLMEGALPKGRVFSVSIA